jgi:hypothetical protein
MMKKLVPSCLLAIAARVCAASLFAQTAEKKEPAAQPKKQKAPPLPGAGTGGNSPHTTTSAVVEGNRVTVVYGQPFRTHPRTKAERKVWGGLVPTDKVWRTGSDEATLLITQRPIEIGGTTVPAGAYTLWTFLKEDGTAKLAINKQIGQWGVPGNQDMKTVYDQANDVVRVDLKKDAIETPLEQFTISIEPNPAGGGLLKLKWDDRQYSAAFSVKK